MKKILVTGHKGYIGTHLINLLKSAGYYVIGYDINLFEGTAWESFGTADEEWIGDFRKITEKELEGVDCVMHLAAISNDPMGDLNPEITYSINKDGSIKLAETAKNADYVKMNKDSIAEWSKK